METIRNPNRGLLTAIIALIFALGFLAAQVPAGENGPEGKLETTIHMHKDTDIMETLIAVGSFNTLVEALRTTEVDQMLRDNGPYTLFAPTDGAFENPPADMRAELFDPQDRERLRRLLSKHIVPERLMLADFPKCCRTIGGGLLTVHVEADMIHVDGSEVIRSDIVSSNGVIHAVDAVMMPKE